MSNRRSFIRVPVKKTIKLDCAKAQNWVLPHDKKTNMIAHGRLLVVAVPKGVKLSPAVRKKLDFAGWVMAYTFSNNHKPLVAGVFKMNPLIVIDQEHALQNIVIIVPRSARRFTYGFFTNCNAPTQQVYFKGTADIQAALNKTFGYLEMSPVDIRGINRNSFVPEFPNRFDAVLISGSVGRQNKMPSAAG